MECDDPVGGRVYIDTVVAPYRRGDGILGAIVAGRDVTDVKSLEGQLIQSEKLAAAGQMAADIGHELNNYLSIISGHAEILGASPEIQRIPDALKSVLAIGEQVGRIERFTSGLMDFSAQNTRKRLTDLNGLIVGLIRFLQPQHRYRNVEFVLRLEEGLPRAEVDDGQIQQVLLNLYANAADAAGTGRVTTSTAFRRDEGKLVVAVSDDGPGIPPEVLDRIFESGFTTKREGHGFGLSICRRIAANHAGDLTLRSEVGSGTTFTLTLPVGRSE
jgi:signal transduction histidine kinase